MPILLAMLLVLFIGGPVGFLIIFVAPLVAMYNSGFLTFMFWCFSPLIIAILGLVTWAIYSTFRDYKKPSPAHIANLRGDEQFVFDNVCLKCGKKNMRVHLKCMHCGAPIQWQG